MVPYYQILGVPRGADKKAIKAAYRQLARKFHPDTNGGHPLAQVRFRLIAEAYNVLTEPEKRQSYDRFGNVGLVRGGDRPGVVAGVERLARNLETAVQSRLNQAPKRGLDWRMKMEVSLAEACFGAQKPLPYTRREACERCGGGGAKPGTAQERCHVCDGAGQITRGTLLRASDPCVFCQGRGVIALQPCDLCEGVGERDIGRSIAVDVPRGVESGRRLVLRGYGEPGKNGGRPGDLYVEIVVGPHELLTRDGFDLHCEVPLSLSEAILGTTARIPTLEGEIVCIRVGAGTQSGQKLRIKGRGAPRGADGPRGDLWVALAVETPNLSNAQAILALNQVEAHASYPKSQAYAARLDTLSK